MPGKSTMIELVDELLRLPPSLGILEMIAEARAGEYHDYKNQKYACGKVAIAGKLAAEASLPKTGKLVRAELMDIRRRVCDGDFDEHADADDLAEMRKTTPRSLWDALGLTPKEEAH